MEENELVGQSKGNKKLTQKYLSDNGRNSQAVEQDQKDVPDNDNLCHSSCAFNVYDYLCSIRRSLVLERDGLPGGALNDGDWPPDESAFGIARAIVIVFLIVWIAIGIRQWFVLSKWTHRYQIYKELQKKTGEKLDSESVENNGEK